MQARPPMSLSYVISRYMFTPSNLVLPTSPQPRTSHRWRSTEPQEQGPDTDLLRLFAPWGGCGGGRRGDPGVIGGHGPQRLCPEQGPRPAQLRDVPARPHLRHPLATAARGGHTAA
jgi:hypothetical protein